MAGEGGCSPQVLKGKGGARTHRRKRTVEGGGYVGHRVDSNDAGTRTYSQTTRAMEGRGEGRSMLLGPEGRASVEVILEGTSGVRAGRPEVGGRATPHALLRLDAVEELLA